VTEVQDLEFPEMKDLGTVRRMQALTRLQASAYRFWEGIEFVVAKVQIQQIRTEDQIGRYLSKSIMSERKSWILSVKCLWLNKRRYKF
jgi:hypothetical protein